MRRSRAKQTSDEDVASALVGDTTGINEEEKPVVGFGETMGVTERVNHTAEVERVGAVAAEAEAVE